MKTEHNQAEAAKAAQDHIEILENLVSSLQAALNQQQADLIFIERWAVHHGAKPHVTPSEALSVIQHYPPIRKITEGYVGGQVPDTFDPFTRIIVLEGLLERAFRALHDDDFENLRDEIRFSLYVEGTQT